MRPIKKRRVPPPPGSPRYRIKEGAPIHYIDGRKLGPGAVVHLRPGIKPGKWLEPMDDPKAADEVKKKGKPVITPEPSNE